MSGGPERPPDTAVPTTTLKRKAFSEEDQRDLEKLDGIFKRLKKNVPESPYILSTPSMYPFRYHTKHDAQAWMMGRLFRPDEEHLQYRTYLFREPYQDCFTLQPGEDNEPEPPPPPSKPAASSSQVPKKKISLSDYKSKHANGFITPGSKKISPNLPPAKAPPPQVNGAKPPAEKRLLPDAQKADAPKMANHTAPNLALPDKPKKPPQTDPSSVPPARPQKVETAENKGTLDKSDPSNSTPHGLPPLLSPVDPPLSNPYGLPPILSPTLPTNVTEALKNIAAKRDRADSNTSTSSSDPKNQRLNVPAPSSQKETSEAKTGGRERSVSMGTKSPAKSPTTRPRAPTESSPKFVVKLKYSRKTGETIKQLLKLPPKSKRENIVEQKEREEAPKDRPAHAQKKPVVESTSSKGKTVPKAAARRPETLSDAASSKAPSTGLKLPQKRPRTEDDGPQPMTAKRPRASSMQEGQKTPKERITPSPALPKSNSQKNSQGLQVTPRKDKGINMLRTASAESYDSTPGKGNASAAPKHLEVKAPPPALLNNKKQADISLLQNASMTMNQRGRSLKHESQKLEREEPGNRKLAAVIGLECILAYMTAFHMQDLGLQLRGRPTEVEATWKTLLPLCASYARLTKDFKHLDGLRSYLAAVVAGGICTLLAPRAPNPRAHDSPHELPHADLAKQHTQVMENFAMLSDHYMQMHRHTQDARVALSMDEMRKLYPKTWSGAETHAKPLPEKVNGIKLSGPYFLPIANDTTPIQAVRFGLKFLHEYCEKERLDHTIRINLDRPE